jgi:penicillin-insensitive murein DD-endopeptidase
MAFQLPHQGGDVPSGAASARKGSKDNAESGSRSSIMPIQSEKGKTGVAVCLTREKAVERRRLGPSATLRRSQQPLNPPSRTSAQRKWLRSGLAILVLSALSAVAEPTRAGNSWSTVSRPSAGPAQVIGGYGAGCIAGAVPLPLAGEGYRVMRPSRNRYYGHPELIRFVETLGRHTAARSGQLLIGDLGQPRGGPMPSGHRSHQAGLDVDVWFRQQSANHLFSPREIEDTIPPSMIRAAAGVPDPALWSEMQADALRFAAQAPEVERIFVNPILKRALCASETDRAWLSKVRPWWGHDQHFHARLACPAGDTRCEPQKPIPPGDGCDADLDRWVEDIRRAALSPKVFVPPPPPSPDKLPSACTAVLDARSSTVTGVAPASASAGSLPRAD